MVCGEILHRSVCRHESRRLDSVVVWPAEVPFGAGEWLSGRMLINEVEKIVLWIFSDGKVQKADDLRCPAAVGVEPVAVLSAEVELRVRRRLQFLKKSRTAPGRSLEKNFASQLSQLRFYAPEPFCLKLQIKPSLIFNSPDVFCRAIRHFADSAQGVSHLSKIFHPDVYRRRLSFDFPGAVNSRVVAVLLF